MDIGQAQRLLGAAGVVDRVDLVLDDEAGFRRRWGAGFLVQSGRERALTMEAMLGAFRVNLQALSLLALLVGVFLVYNTAMFAVVSRRHDAGVLRSLGAGRGEIAAAFCVEILLLGVVGGALGGALGYLLARAAHRDRRRHDQHPLLLPAPVAAGLVVVDPGRRRGPRLRRRAARRAGAAGRRSRGPPRCSCSGAAPRDGRARAARGRRRWRGARWPRRASACSRCPARASSPGIAGSFGVLLGLTLMHRRRRSCCWGRPSRRC